MALVHPKENHDFDEILQQAQLSGVWSLNTTSSFYIYQSKNPIGNVEYGKCDVGQAEEVSFSQPVYWIAISFMYEE